MSNIQTLIFIDSTDDIDTIDNKFLKNTKIFSFNIYAHKKLQQMGIQHELAESYLSPNDRTNIFNYSVNLWKWYEKISEKNQFTFEQINILEILDTNELHDYILNQLFLFVIIKRILEKTNPEKIILNHRLKSISEPFEKKYNLNFQIIGTNPEVFIPFEKFPIRFQIGPFLLKFNMKKTHYFKLKNLFENFIMTILDLNFKPNKKNSLLFLEFDISTYEQLFLKLKESSKNIVFFNHRRSVIWNFKSILKMKKLNGKIINQKLFNKQDYDKIYSKKDILQKNLKLFFTDNINMNSIFVFESIPFWSTVKEQLFTAYFERIEEFLILITLSKKLLEYVSPKCIITLNTLGESEKTVSLSNNKIPMILLEHGFTTYVKETSIFDVSSMYNSFPDKIALWGNIQKHYLKNFHNIPDKNIFTCGSPRHDIFFKNNKINNSKKTLLIVPSPIDTYTALNDTKTYIIFEETMKKIFLILSKYEDLDIIVKLHPGRDMSNNFFKETIKNLNSRIPIYQISPIKEHLEKADAVLHIDSSGIGPSTVVLESLIMQKPILNIVLKSSVPVFSYDEDQALITHTYNSDFSQSLFEIIFDNSKRNTLLTNGNIFLDKYLSNRGNASEEFVKLLNSY